jgi:hypothetical protein
MPVPFSATERDFCPLLQAKDKGQQDLRLNTLPSSSNVPEAIAT